MYNGDRISSTASRIVDFPELLRPTRMLTWAKSDIVPDFMPLKFFISRLVNIAVTSVPNGVEGTVRNYV